MTLNDGLVQRPYYSDWLEHWRDKKVIKVLIGLRRCGKSTLLELFQGKLRQQGVARENILAINFESMEEQYPTQARELYDYIAAKLSKGTNYSHPTRSAYPRHPARSVAESQDLALFPGSEEPLQ